jgi:PAS domain S-box-containing protein
VPHQPFKHTDPVFESLFERSADAIWLYDPQTIVLLDCNEAAVKLIGARDKQQLLRTRPEQLSPPLQPDGTTSEQKSAEIVALVEQRKAHRFEWVIRRLDNGTDIPVEVTSTAMPIDGKTIHVIVSRDISERKKAERELLEMTQALERRVGREDRATEHERGALSRSGRARSRSDCRIQRGCGAFFVWKSARLRSLRRAHVQAL